MHTQIIDFYEFHDQISTPDQIFKFKMIARIADNKKNFSVRDRQTPSLIKKTDCFISWFGVPNLKANIYLPSLYITKYVCKEPALAKNWQITSCWMFFPQWSW